MKTILLANTESRGYHIPQRRKLLHAFAKAQNAELILLDSKGDLFGPAAAAIDQADRIFIAGGDGTFDAALNNKLFEQKTLGFFPLGLGNQIYWYLYGDRHFNFLSEQITFKEQAIDVLEISWNNNKRNSLSISIGMDAEVMRLTKRTKGHPFYDYVIAILKSSFLGKSRFQITLMENTSRKEYECAQSVTLGKIPHYGYGIRAIPKSIIPDDGNIYGTVVYKKQTPLSAKLNRLLTLYKIHKGTKTETWDVLKAPTITVESKAPLPLQAGGEYLGEAKHIAVSVKRTQRILTIADK